MRIPLATVMARATSGPANCFGLMQGTLEAGRPADICVIDDEADWEFDIGEMRSQGKNSPYQGWGFQARPSVVFVNGEPLDLAV